MNSCKICNIGLENIRKLSKHIRDNHKQITIKQYYDKYIKAEFENICCICGKETKYCGLGQGYKETCPRTCSAKLFRIRLKENEQKNNLFKQKVKNNMIELWKQRELSGEKKIIIEKSKIKNKKTISELTKEEKKIRFGWLNKLNDVDKENKIKELISPLIKYYENITDDEYKLLCKKRNDTMLKNKKNQPDQDQIVYELSDEGKEQIKKFFGIE